MARAGAAARGRLTDVEDSILQLCVKHPEGITQALIQESEGIEMDDIMKAVNALMKEHRLTMLMDPTTNNVVWRAMAASETSKYKGLSAEELLIFQHIQKSGNTGLWTKDMKARTNLQQPQITKILKQLESRKLIKVVKSVASANRKVYMEYDLEPSREITGGAWYTDHNFDAEFIKLLREACIGYIQRQKEPTLSEIAQFMQSKGVSKEPLADEDYGMVLDTLCLDGKVERILNPGGEDRFALPPLPMLETTALTSMPCGVCPVAAECTPDGAISPENCIYYKEWLF